jgi:Xaa-Pro aminopeptidase
MATMDVYAERRRRFMDQIGPRAVAIIAGRGTTHRNSDVEHRFRQPSDLLYLTGFAEPETWAVLAPGRDQPFSLFVRPRDPERETWTGRRAGVEGAVARFGADRAFAIDTLKAELPRLLDGAEEVLYVPGEDREVDEVVSGALAYLRGAERRGMRAPSTITDLRTSLHEQRLCKDESAITTLERAAAITCTAHTAAMRAARGGVMEYEIEALVDYTFRRHGGFTGYGTICGGGNNATILHYVDNDQPLQAGALLLVDAGCEIDGFTADVTRTYPVGAKFSVPQRELYELVLATEKACIQEVKPGVTIDGIHAHAVERLTEGMVRLGLLHGEPKALIESGAYKRYYMHRTSHWLGLDVHDVGAYARDGQPRPLEAGMVLTVEPGIYVSADDEAAPARYRGIGIRIEDDVLVTKDGHRVLTRAIPKEVDELEALTTS